jgi:hypothetical protein
MMAQNRSLALGGIGLALLALGACTPSEPKDYSVYREHLPASILVLPPINQSVEVNASYSLLSTVTTPLATAGYYVFPVAVVDAYMKENGLPTAADMHNVPLDKIDEVFGADAVLYLDVKEYGQEYNLVSSSAVVNADAKLVDVDTGLTLWEGRAAAEQSSGDSGLLGAALVQALGTTFDTSHGVAISASQNMVLGRDGLLQGPYHPGHEQDTRGRPPAAEAVE